MCYREPGTGLPDNNVQLMVSFPLHCVPTSYRSMKIRCIVNSLFHMFCSIQSLRNDGESTQRNCAAATLTLSMLAYTLLAKAISWILHQCFVIIVVHVITISFVLVEILACHKLNGIKHIRCAPYHPSSNGLAERFVKTFKKAAVSAREFQGLPLKPRLENVLLGYRSTPHATTHRTPSSLFLQRDIRTCLDLLKPTCGDMVTCS